MLVDIGGGHSLSPQAAASWFRTIADGNPGRVINSSTRDYATQLDWYRNKGEPGYPKYVADPNESKHVWRPNDKRDKGARALDLNDPARAWMVKNGARHGWFRPWPDIEPWHFEYDISKDRMKDMALSDKDIEKIVKGVWAETKNVGKSAGDTLGTRTPSAMLMLQQGTYARRDAREALARIKAVEAAINKGTAVSAKDVARELRPLIAADIRAAVKDIPANEADKIADAVLAAFGEALISDD